MSVFTRPCQRGACLAKFETENKPCKHKRWHYEFVVRGQRYRGALPEARTKWHAEQAESRIRDSVFEGKFGGLKPSPAFDDFVRKSYLPWSETNKRSHEKDGWRCDVLIKHFGKKRLDEITPEMIEKFKTLRRDGITERGTRRSKASVNRELEILARIFSLAVQYERTTKNPSLKVQRFVLQNSRARYLTHEEETNLRAVMTGKLSYLLPILIVGIGTGLRPPSEIFGLKRSSVDFERNVLRAGTKTDEEREIPMSLEVREALLELYQRNTGSEYLFVSWRTRAQMKSVKNGFRRALHLAGIKDASLYTMRHTFGTRLGAEGYNAYEIMALMGHRDIKTSSGYVHATNERTRAAVGSVFRQAAENSTHKSPTNEQGQLLKVSASG